MPEPVIAAFDVGVSTGFAWGRAGGLLPAGTGRWSLPKASLGARCVKLEDNVQALVRAHGITFAVIAERFVGARGGNNPLLFGLDAAVEMGCAREGVKLYVQPERMVRKEIFGPQKGRTTSEQWKALALGWCIDQGLKVSGHDEADACVLWAWTRREIVRQATASRQGP